MDWIREYWQVIFICMTAGGFIAGANTVWNLAQEIISLLREIKNELRDHREHDRLEHTELLNSMKEHRLVLERVATRLVYFKE